MEKEFDLLVFIGRFQPYHLEHKRVIDIALQKAKNVLVLVGSAGSPRTIRNPFTFDERKQMIENSFYSGFCNKNGLARIFIKPLYDKTYNDSAWINQVQSIVKETALNIVNDAGFPNHGLADAKIGLIGMAKDHTSFYLKMFPQYDSVDVPLECVMHATGIRESYFEGKIKKHEVVGNELPSSTSNYLFDDFINTPEYTQLSKELTHIKAYKSAWKAAPYPVKHVTVDAIVEQSGHILLIRRRAEPGRGLWALPGGHLEEHETITDGIFRELEEETKLAVPPAVIRGSIVNTGVFDDPYRSTIGRVITHAAHIKLKPDVKLPKIKGSDDADKARWVPISEIRENEMYDDHYHILQYFLGVD